MLRTDRFVTVEVTDRDESKKYLNLHSTRRALRYMGYIERTAMNPTQDAWGRPKEKSNVKDKDGNEHPESSSANFKSTGDRERSTTHRSGDGVGRPKEKITVEEPKEGQRH